VDPRRPYAGPNMGRLHPKLGHRARLAAGLGLAALAGLAVAAPNTALASPGVDGTRNLSMGNATRASSGGTDAAIINPAGISYTQRFEIEPIYQLDYQTGTHGMGAFISDSLNSSRVALALGYVFMRGTPRIRYNDVTGDREALALVHFGHEVSGVLSITAVKNWVYIAVKPKWQYTSLRYLDDEGQARDYKPKLNAFGLDAAIAINLLDWAKIAVVGYNLVGPSKPARTDTPTDDLPGVAVGIDPQFNDTNLRRIADYPRSLGHGFAVFPLRSPNFSLNVDATYDFTSYRTEEDKWTRITVNAGGEFVAGPVPIRLGGWWDSRGRMNGDDRGYVSAGLGYIRPAELGGIGVDIGVGFAQQVTGSITRDLDTILSINIGLRLQPNL
jgi:hypothetical protein